MATRSFPLKCVSVTKYRIASVESKPGDVVYSELPILSVEVMISELHLANGVCTP